MENQLETIIYKNHTINIYPDTDVPNPLEDFEFFGTFSCFHRHYTLSSADGFSDQNLLVNYLKSGNAVYLPLYLYDHSGITMSTTSFSCPWDSGQVGFIHVSKDKIYKEYNCKRIQKKILETVKQRLTSEVNTFDMYLRGEVYYYRVLNSKGEQTDSCGGWYGNWNENGMIKEVMEIIDHNIKKKIKEHCQQLKVKIKHKVPLFHRQALTEYFIS